MTNTTKTVLIVGGVAAGVLLIAEFVRSRAAAPASSSKPSNGSGAWLSGLLQFGTSIVNAVGSSSSSSSQPSGNPTGVYDPNWGTKGIDPDTGGVYLPDGATYGPPTPTGAGVLS